MAQAAMFSGLVVDENDEVAEVTYVGTNACYVVYDDDFKRHIDAENVDRQVLRFFREQVEQHRDIAVDSMMEFMGKDDLFTKAALETSINNMEQNIGQQIPEQQRQMLGMLGFKIVIDFQGNVVDINMPAAGAEGEEGDEW